MSPREATSTTPPFPRRRRPLYAAFILLTIAAGLASRSALASHLPVFVATYAGDVLWALTLFLVLGFALPKTWPGMIAVATLALAFASSSASST